MLVLARRIGETIVINETIRVTVVEVQPHKVRLAFEAPRDVRIDRAEIHERCRHAVAPAVRANGAETAALMLPKLP